MNILAEKDVAKAASLQSELLMPTPSDLFDSKLVQEMGWTEEDCVQRILDDAMPEKVKEKKTENVAGQAIKGGAEVFIPKKRTHKVRYPKGFDPENPGKGPDPERWLPKWQRSRFKKLAKKKGIYLKGAQGDAQIDTDVTGANMAKSTAHKEAATGANKKRKRK